MDRITGPDDMTHGTFAYVVIGVVVVVCAISGLGAFASGGNVLHHVASPGGELIAVCQENSGFVGGYAIRLERPDGGAIRNLYAIGDGDPCSELVWSADGQTLAVLSEHVGRVRFVDVGWALAHREVRTAYWSWRQVDLSSERERVRAVGLRFANARSVEVQACTVNASGACVRASTRRFEVPMPIVTAHNVNPG
jgi:hypothetical protein